MKSACVEAFKGIHFCYPIEKQGNFHLAFDPELNANSDIQTAHQLFHSQIPTSIPYESADNAPEGVKDKRVLNITSLIPKNLKEKAWSGNIHAGPNCYQAALCASGFDYLCDRYVDTIEAEFILSIFFKPAPKKHCREKPGTVAIHSESRRSHGRLAPITSNHHILHLESRLRKKLKDRDHIWIPKPPLFHLTHPSGLLPFRSAGVHATYTLLGGMAFHKLSYDARNGYRIDPIDNAMKQVDDAGERLLSPFERRWGHRSEKHYSYTCHELIRPITPDIDKAMEMQSRASLSQEKRNYYLTLFRFYSRLITDLSKEISRKDPAHPNRAMRFERIRISLLTIENMWQILRDFKKEMDTDTKNFLSKDWELAKAYFTAHSLSWQYQAMCDQFFPMKPGRLRSYYDSIKKELFTRHYFKYNDSRFIHELQLYLHLRGIPQEEWRTIIQKIIARLRRFDPQELAMLSKQNKVSFKEILEANSL